MDVPAHGADASALTDAQWAILEQLTPACKPGGRRREVVEMREVVNTILCFNPPGARRFTQLPKRWVAERTLAWHERCRRQSEDYERGTDSSEFLVRVTAIDLPLRRLPPPDQRTEFHDRTAA